MKRLVSHVLMIAAAVSVATCPAGTTQPATRHEEESLANSIVVRQNVIQEAIASVGKIALTEPKLSAAEANAIRVLGAYRSAEACEDLLRVVKMTWAERIGAVPIAGGKTQPRVRFPLDGLPAAKALRDIGLPAVKAIIADLQQKQDPKAVKDDLLRIYADILVGVLGTEHAKDYVEKEKKRVGDSHRDVFERLLKIPAMTRVTGWKLVDPE